MNKNGANELNVAILVLFAFHYWYVGFWSYDFLVEFGGVEWWLSLSFYFLLWLLLSVFFWRVLLFFLCVIFFFCHYRCLVLFFLFYCCLVDVNIINNFIIIIFYFFIILQFLRLCIIHACNVDIIRLNLLQNLLLSVTKIKSQSRFLFLSHFNYS